MSTKPDVIVTIVARDGRTFELFRRNDQIRRPSGTRPAYGWRTRRNGRVIATNGQALERYRAIRQAKTGAGPGARVRTAR